MNVVEFTQLTFKDDFVFCIVLKENPDLCKQITELATGRKIKKIVGLQNQKSIKESPDGRGVRFDVVFEDDENTIYDIEMQQTDKHNLPKRTRYYQSLTDLESLKQGKSFGYNCIKDAYIIFICTFDPFGKGMPKYLAKTTVVEHPELNFDDGIRKVFLNAEYTENVEDAELKQFLDFVRLNLITSELTGSLYDAVQRVLDSDERRTEYMFLWEKLEEMKAEGKAEEEQENVLSAIREGLPKDVIMKVFKLTAEKYAQYAAML